LIELRLTEPRSADAEIDLGNTPLTRILFGVPSRPAGTVRAKSRDMPRKRGTPNPDHDSVKDRVKLHYNLPPIDNLS